MEKATRPTLYFIGVTTAQSSIMRIFPEWSRLLGLGADIRGIDFRPHSSSEGYREAAGFIKEDPLSLGALVTTHKIDLFAACRDMFDYADPYAELLGETSCLSKKDGKFCAHAKDPISSGLSIERILPAGHWAGSERETLILGAGGAALAMSVYLSDMGIHKDNVPCKITISNRSAGRLESARAILGKLDTRTKFEYRCSPMPEQNDALIAGLPEGSFIVNATGLGKDAPGSPITDAAVFPQNSYAWELNYRGDLVFKEQAARQASRNIKLTDGWDYFIYGWTQVISEVFHIEIDDEKLAMLAKAADAFRR